MKIVYVITRLDRGGSSESVKDLCVSLSKKNYRIVLIYGGDTFESFDFKAYHIKYLNREINLVNDIKSFFKIIKVFFIEKPDIVHTHTSKAGIIGRWACFFYKLFKNKKVKIFHTPRGHIFYGYFNPVKTFIFRIIEKITALITDKLIALTDGERDESIYFGVGNEKKWIVIPSGVSYNIKINNPNLKNEMDLDKFIVVGTVLRFEKVKGLEYFLKSIPLILSDLKNRDRVRFLVVGDGREKENIEKLIDILDVKKYLIFTGWREDVIDLISIMDIYVQPSLNEGMGRTIVYASLLSKPIVATSVCGIKSVVIDNKTGFLVRAKDIEQLGVAVMKLLNDEKLRVEFGQNAKKWVNELIDGWPRFSFEKSLYLLEKLYNESLMV